MTTQLLQGDCRDILPTLPERSVQCVVTSPPYYGLRDYGVAGQLGLEQTPDEYIQNMVSVFRECRRVLRDDGTLWLNIGDSYSGSWGNYGGQNRGNGTQRAIVNGSKVHQQAYDQLEGWRPPTSNKIAGIKNKDLIGIPWMLAFALRADGWYLRCDIIWHKPNPMPESVTDRPTRSHEYLFLFAKQARYYYDSQAIAEPVKQSSLDRINQPTFDEQTGGPKDYGTTGVNGNRSMRRTLENFAKGRGGHNAFRGQGHFRESEGGPANRDGREMRDVGSGPTRNRRTVWTIATRPYSGAHFAVMPEQLIEPCILAGSRPGDVVLDPFAGSGTTLRVAERLGRNSIGIELNADYIKLQEKRTDGIQRVMTEVL